MTAGLTLERPLLLGLSFFHYHWRCYSIYSIITFLMCHFLLIFKKGLLTYLCIGYFACMCICPTEDTIKQVRAALLLLELNSGLLKEQ